MIYGTGRTNWLVLNMTHNDFTAAYRAGSIKVHVHRRLALQMMDTSIAPRRYRAAHLLWTWIWFLSFPAALGLFIWHTWWSGLALLLFALFPLRAAVGESACQFVLETALEREDFYLAAIKARALIVDSKE